MKLFKRKKKVAPKGLYVEMFIKNSGYRDYTDGTFEDKCEIVLAEFVKQQDLHVYLNGLSLFSINYKDVKITKWE